MMGLRGRAVEPAAHVALDERDQEIDRLRTELAGAFTNLGETENALAGQAARAVTAEHELKLAEGRLQEAAALEVRSLPMLPGSVFRPTDEPVGALIYDALRAERPVPA